MESSSVASTTQPEEAIASVNNSRPADKPVIEVIAELTAAGNNAYLPKDQSEKLYFYCFAMQILLRCVYKIMSEDCLGCFITAVDECAHTCNRGVGAFMGFLRDNFCTLVEDADATAVRVDFAALQARFPDIPGLDLNQLNALEFRCRSCWRSALYFYIDANFKRYPSSWLDEFTPDSLATVPKVSDMVVSLGTGTHYFVKPIAKNQIIGLYQDTE